LGKRAKRPDAIVFNGDWLTKANRRHIASFAPWLSHLSRS
jgi:hypothetical protein